LLLKLTLAILIAAERMLDYLNLPPIIWSCYPLLARVCKPAYYKPVPNPRNREGCGREGIRRKKYLGLRGWTYSRSHLCGCCRPAVVKELEARVRGDQ